MNVLKPKYSIIPSSPYKTIVGVTEEELVSGISNLWKNKFKSAYGH